MCAASGGLPSKYRRSAKLARQRQHWGRASRDAQTCSIPTRNPTTASSTNLLVKQWGSPMQRSRTSTQPRKSSDLKGVTNCLGQRCGAGHAKPMCGNRPQTSIQGRKRSPCCQHLWNRLGVPRLYQWDMRPECGKFETRNRSGIRAFFIPSDSAKNLNQSAG